MALLTLVQQNLTKPISQNWANTSKESGGLTNFVQLQIEVETKDLRKLLGPALLLDIQKNPTDAKYVDLLDGLEYENANGDTVKFEGIRYQLAYMNFSKYVFESRVADTMTGFVKKVRTESEDLSQGDIRRIQIDAQEMAMADFDLMAAYLDDNTETYTLWKCANIKRPFTPKLTTIRKTIK
jgi:hypothetical protein